MKIRLTILTENNRPRPNGVTEEQIAKVWQETFNALTLFAENNDKATVEKVEFLADGGRRCGEGCGVWGERMRSCETCRHTLGGGYCFGCNRSTGFHKWEPKPMTNYDCLISKTPEELAEWICCHITECESCEGRHYDGQECEFRNDHFTGLLRWLKSPVEVNDGA